MIAEALNAEILRLRSVVDHDDGVTFVGEELVSSRNPGPLEAGGDELLPYGQVGTPNRDNSPVVQYSG